MSQEILNIMDILNDFVHIKVLYGNSFTMFTDDLETLQSNIEKILIELKDKNGKLNKKDDIINDAIKWLETLQSNGTSCNNGDLQLVLNILEENENV